MFRSQPRPIVAEIGHSLPLQPNSFSRFPLFFFWCVVICQSLFEETRLGPGAGVLRDPPGVCALLEQLKPEVECICLAGFYHLSFICVTSFKQLDCDVITIIIEPPGDLHN